MTDKHPLDDADLDFGDGEEFEAEMDDGFGDDEDFGDDDEDAIDDDGDEAELEDDEDDDVPLPAEDDEDDDVHPSDVEADLEEILRDRIAASDDDEEDEEEEVPGQTKAAASVAPPRSDEWTCDQCFLIVSVSQFGSRANPVCPSGEEPCESIERIRGDLDRRGR